MEDRQPRHRRPSVLLPPHVPTSAPSTRSCGPLVLRKPAIDAPTVPAYRAQSHGAPRSGPKGNVRMGGVGGWRPSSLSASLPQGFWALLPEASLP